MDSSKVLMGVLIPIGLIAISAGIFLAHKEIRSHKNNVIKTSKDRIAFSPSLLQREINAEDDFLEFTKGGRKFKKKINKHKKLKK